MIFINDSFKPSFGFAAQVLGSLFIGYCFYFDRKRTSAPGYREKIIKRRELEHMKNQKIIECKRRNRVFRYESQSAKLALRTGQIVQGVEHIINALLICDRPELMMEILHTKLTARVFDMVINRLNRLECLKSIRDEMFDEISHLTDDTLDALDESIQAESISEMNSEKKYIEYPSNYDQVTCKFAAAYI